MSPRTSSPTSAGTKSGCPTPSSRATPSTPGLNGRGAGAEEPSRRRNFPGQDHGFQPRRDAGHNLRPHDNGLQKRRAPGVARLVPRELAPDRANVSKATIRRTASLTPPTGNDDERRVPRIPLGRRFSESHDAAKTKRPRRCFALYRAAIETPGERAREEGSGGQRTLTTL